MQTVINEVRRQVFDPDVWYQTPEQMRTQVYVWEVRRVSEQVWWEVVDL